jgi:hypothetical protein
LAQTGAIAKAARRTGHCAVVASFVVEFGASWGKFAIIDCCSNGGHGECPSAEYSFCVTICKKNIFSQASANNEILRHEGV